MEGTHKKDMQYGLIEEKRKEYVMMTINPKMMQEMKELEERYIESQKRISEEAKARNMTKEELLKEWTEELLGDE